MRLAATTVGIVTLLFTLALATAQEGEKKEGAGGDGSQDKAEKEDEAADMAPLERKIRELLELTGGGSSTKQQVIEGMKISLPGGSDDFYEYLIDDEDIDLLIDLMVPLYEKHFTEAEIDEAIAFYKTELGRKLAKRMQLITLDMVAVGQKWSMKLTPKITLKMMQGDFEGFEGQLPLALRQARSTADETSAIGALRTISSVQAMFREGDRDNDNVLDYATSLEELSNAGLIDNVLGTGEKNGYKFKLSGDTFDWSCTAVPLDEESGKRNFIVCTDGVVRFAPTFEMPTCSSAAIQ